MEEKGSQRGQRVSLSVVRGEKQRLRSEVRGQTRQVNAVRGQ